MQLRYKGMNADGDEVDGALDLEHRIIAGPDDIARLREQVAAETGLTDVKLIAWG